MSLLHMSMSGGILILFIVIVRGLAAHRLPKTTFLVLWILAALRLLLPFSLPLPFHVGIFPSMAQNVPAETVSALLSEGHLLTDDAGPAECGPILRILWLSGVLLLALYFFISYFRSMRKFRMSIPDNTPYIREWLTTHQIVRPMEVRSSDLISSPLTYGILRPVILLPKNRNRHDTVALQYVLTHEYIHIRRFDAITKLLFAAALCIHWFNPLAWVMYVLANRDMELSCDARVIRMMGMNNRSSYARMLIDLAEQGSGMAPLCSHFGKTAISERIEAIMKFKKTSTVACVMALVMVAGATTVFATSSTPKYEDTSSIAITGVPDRQSDRVVINLTTAGDGQELQLAEDIAASKPITIHLEDAESEDTAGGPDEGESADATLISVSRNDESKFTPEEWESILRQIEEGTVYWED